MDMAAQKKLFAHSCCCVGLQTLIIRFVFELVLLEFICLIYIQCWKLISISALYMVLSISRYGVGAKS